MFDRGIFCSIIHHISLVICIILRRGILYIFRFIRSTARHCCNNNNHHHHDHDADEVFTSWGVETARKFTKAEVEHALTELDTGNYGMILRSKGIVDGGADGWLEFDYVPGEWEVRARGADVGGKLVVIGSKLNEKAIAELFGC